MSAIERRSFELLELEKMRLRIRDLFRLVNGPCHCADSTEIHELMQRLPFHKGAALDYEPASAGRIWGPDPEGSAWFRVRLTIPEELEGRPVTFRFPTGGHALVFLDGRPFHAFDHRRDSFLLTNRARAGTRYEIHVDASPGWTVAHSPEVTLPYVKREIQWPYIAEFRPAIWELANDLQALWDMIDPEVKPLGWTGRFESATLPADSTRRARLHRSLHRATDEIDFDALRDEQSRAAAIERVRAVVRPLMACKATASAQKIAAIGHSHIDLAWLWPYRETIRKAARTFSTQLRLLERYPKYRFTQSQPQIYQSIKEHYPDLYAEIKSAIAEGRWDPCGAVWVEMDCNVPSGESLVRQVLYGTKFLAEEFAHECRTLWLPDVFGYSPVLPQILRRAGIDYFLTQKINWNQHTTFPYHSFYWEGIDGSRVLAHFLPADQYNNEMLARELLSSERLYAEKDRARIQCFPFGTGDGGGGPVEAEIERCLRYEDLEGMPRVRLQPPDDFFHELEETSEALPIWNGELYLEFHRGTLTSGSHYKRENRHCEQLLGEAEMLAAWRWLDGASYPAEALEQAWKRVLLNQFHDILPGSSVPSVYEDAAQHYREVRRTLAGLVDEAIGKPSDEMLVNATQWERVEPIQSSGGGEPRLVAVPPFAVVKLDALENREPLAPVSARERILENGLLRLEFDESGVLRSCFDKEADIETLDPQQPGNRLLLFEDWPNYHEAWDIYHFYEDKPPQLAELTECKLVEKGPLTARLRMVYRASRSLIRQDVVVRADSRRVDFETIVQWKDERKKMLKVAFTPAVRTPHATYEIQYGAIERPTHRNTAADRAKFEVFGHRWADLSDGTRGFALLNDCKYGYDVHQNTLRLTLLRSPQHPCPDLDTNHDHPMTYSIFPHAGRWQNGVVRAGCELNAPLRIQRGEHEARPPFRFDSDGVVLDAVKRSEDGRRLVVRFYEAHGTQSRGELIFTRSPKLVHEGDLRERPERSLEPAQDRLPLAFQPFQIRTLLLDF